MDVSVIIVNYNTFELTCSCIRSVYKYCQPDSTEVILVDNGSVEREPAQFKSRFPAVKLVVSKENLGFAMGNNLGIAQASGKYILLLNSDTVISDNAIASARQFLDRHREVAVATVKLVYPDGTVQHNCQRFPRIDVKLFEFLRMQKLLGRRVGGKVLLGPFFRYDCIIYPDWVWGTFFMFRRSLLDELKDKRLAEDFFMYGEDMQWCFEFRRLGYQIAFLPEGVVMHYVGQSGAQRNTVIGQNTKRFIDMYYKSWRKWIINSLDKILQA